MEVLYPYGKLDLLYYYSKTCKKVAKYLGDRELASVVFILPGLRLIKRATKFGKLYARDISASRDFLKFRAGHHLKDAKGKFSKRELMIWEYIYPRKLVELHYAINTEDINRKIDRVYIDIDRGSIPAEDVQKVADSLIKLIKRDVKCKFFILWTGNSFHINLLLPEMISHAKFHELYSINGKYLKNWAYQATKDTGISIIAGHEKRKGIVILDTSQSPPGKLARAPFSVYVSKGIIKKITGIAVPVSEKELNDNNLISKLKSLTPEKVLKNLSNYNL